MGGLQLQPLLSHLVTLLPENSFVIEEGTPEDFKENALAILMPPKILVNDKGNHCWEPCWHLSDDPLWRPKKFDLTPP